MAEINNPAKGLGNSAQIDALTQGDATGIVLPIGSSGLKEDPNTGDIIIPFEYNSEDGQGVAITSNLDRKILRIAVPYEVTSANAGGQGKIAVFKNYTLIHEETIDTSVRKTGIFELEFTADNENFSINDNLAVGSYDENWSLTLNGYMNIYLKK